MKCRVEGCDNEMPALTPDIMCAACTQELDTGLRAGLAQRLGRPPTDAEMCAFLDRVLARRPKGDTRGR